MVIRKSWFDYSSSFSDCHFGSDGKWCGCDALMSLFFTVFFPVLTFLVLKVVGEGMVVVKIFQHEAIQTVFSTPDRYWFMSAYVGQRKVLIMDISSGNIGIFLVFLRQDMLEWVTSTTESLLQNNRREVKQTIKITRQQPIEHSHKNLSNLSTFRIYQRCSNLPNMLIHEICWFPT